MRLGLIFDRDHKRVLTSHDFIRAGIDGDLRNASLQIIPESASYREKIVWYIDHLDENIREGVGLILIGENGSGKSAAASIISKEVMCRGASVLFIEEAVLIRKTIEREDFNDEMSFMERAEGVDLLILDDVGLSAKSDNLHLTEELVKFRLHRNRSLILTTNKTPQDFKARYPSMADAIRGKCLPVRCAGVDWRGMLEKNLRDRFERESKNGN